MGRVQHGDDFDFVAVIPAKAGIQFDVAANWAPACAGATSMRGVIPAKAGIHFARPALVYRAAMRWGYRDCRG